MITTITNRLKPIWNGIRDFVGDLLNREKPIPAPADKEEPVDPTQQQTLTNKTLDIGLNTLTQTGTIDNVATRFYKAPEWTEIKISPLGISPTAGTIPEYEQHNKELDTYFRYRMTYNNYHNMEYGPLITPNQFSLLPRHALISYLEQAKLYESALGAEYWEAITTQGWIHIDENATNFIENNLEKNAEKFIKKNKNIFDELSK